MSVQTFTDFTAAQTAATDAGLSVCGTFRSGEPVYFLAEPEVSDEELRGLSFEVQNGRPMTEDEQALLAFALKEKPLAFAVDLDELAS